MSKDFKCVTIGQIPFSRFFVTSYYPKGTMGASLEHNLFKNVSKESFFVTNANSYV